MILPERPVPRHGDFDYRSIKDKIGLVDLKDLNLNSNSTEMWDHVAKSLELPGVMASNFIKLSNKNHIGIFLAKDSAINFVVIDINSLKIIKTIPSSIAISPELLDFLNCGDVDRNLEKVNSSFIQQTDG